MLTVVRAFARMLLAVSCLLVMIACGGGGGGEKSIQPPTVQPSSLTVNVMGTSATSVTGSVVATDPQGLALTYSVTTPPTVGTVSINATTGTFTYTVSSHTTATTDSFRVSVSNGRASATATISAQVGIDPLLPNQWHIQNTGQNAFSSTLPVAGNDMNVADAWSAGYSGKGIKVGVVDSGLEAAHEDLAANVDVAHSFNFVTGLNDPTRPSSEVGDDHGTSVAGIIGAIAFNGKGGRGVAYRARLRGYNLLEPNLTFSINNMAKSLGSDPMSADNDVFNASFERGPCGLPSFSGAYQSIASTTLTLRNGHGAAIVNAAGNSFGDWKSPDCAGLCTYANQYGVSCGDPATDERRGGYVPIIVGALNSEGAHSSYSTAGSALWISAPGGEYGLNNSYVPGLDSSTYEPAITTTARTGCPNAAYPASQFPSGVNQLNSNGANALAATCQYTAVMNGTSAATPNVAGVVALMLEANPNLSVRDIKYILAKTAKRVDSRFSGVSSSSIFPGSTIVLEQGWTTNAAGWTFSNRYGFGAVDAAAAVEMAKSYTSYLPAVQESAAGKYELYAAPPATIPYSATGAYVVFHVSESFSTVEHAVVFLNIAATPGLLCNQVELTSPSGTKSILIHAANGFANASVANSRVLSNAFYGEQVNGDWILTFYDFCADGIYTQLSTTNPQILGIVGH